MWTRLRRLLGRGPRQESITVPVDDQAEPLSGEDLLLVSDLHVGEACKEHSRIDYLKHSGNYDSHICALLEHYTQHRPNDRPWRLILAGDLLDFLQVTVVPVGASEDARRYGLGTCEDESVWKLRRLMERHRRVFVYLAAFIGAGNRVELVQGNHDEELFWPEVRRGLVDGLVDLYFGDETGAKDDHDRFRERVHFNSWFYYQPDLIYVEHGHRFDEFCVTPPQMAPLRPQDEGELTLPMSALAIRYFSNLEQGFTTHDKEHWRIPDYVRFYRERGSVVKKAIEVLRRYFTLIGKSFSYHLQHGRFESDQAKDAHLARVAELSETTTLTPAQLQALDALSARSVMADPLGLYAILGLAEMTGALALFVTLIVLALTSWGVWIDLAVVSMVGFGVFRWAKFVRRRFPTDIRRKLDEKADAISQIVNVPVVAMGHCHRPKRKRLAHNHRHFYLNTGNFLAPETPAHAPGERCTCSTTYVELHQPDVKGVSPELKRWCCIDNAPRPFDPG